MKNSISIIHQLEAFVNSRPGFDPYNYATYKDLQADRRIATKQKNDFYYLVWAFSSIWHKRNPQGTTIQEYVYNRLKNNSGRLSITDKNEIRYITGQYYCTEYRAAACRFVASVLWDFVREHYTELETGDDMRKFFKRNITNKSALKYLI